MKISAPYRTALYAVTIVFMALAILGSAVGIIPAGAITRGVDAGAQLLTLFSGIMAITHVNPST